MADPVSRPGWDAYVRGMRRADQTLAQNVLREYRRIAEPLAVRVRRRGAAPMPASGGFAALVANRGRVDITTTIRGRLVEVGAGLAGGGNLAALDRGELRHKVFDMPGREVTWVLQRVPKGTFTRAVQEQIEAVAKAAEKAVTRTVDDIARKA